MNRARTDKYVEELRVKSAVRLKEALVSARKELFNLRFQSATSQLGNAARISKVRKSIAGIQTVITEQARA